MEQLLLTDVDRLIMLLSSRDADMRIYSAGCLSRLDCREEKVRLALETVALNDPDVFVQEEARSALQQLGRAVPGSSGEVFLEPQLSSPAEMLTTLAACKPSQAPAVYGTYAVSFGERFIAFILDNLVIWVASIAVSWVGQAVAGVPLLAFVVGVFVLLPFLYFAQAYSTSGQTAGKRQKGIKVISADGMPLTRTQGILRALAYLLSGVPAYLGFLSSIWDPKKQTWHDKIAGTYVVKAYYVSAQLPGASRSVEEIRRQKRWLLGIGIPMVLLFASGAGLFTYYLQKNIAEVRAMGPWPGVDVSPQELVNLDLSSLRLESGQTMDAKSEPWSANLSFEEGTYKTYLRGETPMVAIWALRYPDRRTASGDYAALQEWAKGIGAGYRTAYTPSAGIIHLVFSDLYSKTFWNDRWIVVIDAAQGTEYPPAVLVDKVRDAMAAHWKN